MKKIYACLLGDWVCLNDDPHCLIDEAKLSPSEWWENDAPIWNPFKPDNENTLYQMPYVNISYKGKDYRINPIFIQIVNE